MQKLNIVNTTRRKKIANAKVCSTLLSKAQGLMLSTRPMPLIFIFNKEKIIPLHMCFVFFPIDVIFLNKSKKVVEIKENFLPWTFYTPRNRAQYVIELPKNTARRTGTKIGDIFSF